MKQITTVVATLTEAILLAHLAKQNEWTVWDPTTANWEDRLAVTAEADGRQVYGRNAPHPKAEILTISAFVDFLKNTPRPLTIVLTNSAEAIISPDRHSVRIAGHTFNTEDVLGWRDHLTATDETVEEAQKNQVFYFKFDDNDKLRLAGALAEKAGWEVDDPTDKYYWEDYKVLVFDKRGTEAWGESDGDQGERVQIESLDDLLTFIQNIPKFKKVDLKNGMEALVSESGGIVHVGCQTFTSKSLIELGDKMVVKPVEKAAPATTEPTRKVHNPANVNISFLGEGYRFLDEDESGANADTAPHSKYIQQWLGDHWDDGGNLGNSRELTYRTKLTREQLAAHRRGEKVEVPEEEPAF